MAEREPRPGGVADPPVVKAKAKAPRRSSSLATLTITAPNRSWLGLLKEQWDESARFVASAHAEAVAVLNLVDKSTFDGDVFSRVRDYLQSRPLSSQGVLALVLLAEARGREARARSAGSGRNDAARAWVIAEWNKLTPEQQGAGKANFARTIAPSVERRFETSSGKRLRINPDRIAKAWLK